jgi:hypothetical protein
LITTLVFEKNANFFAENYQKSEKIVIITSVPGQDTRKAENATLLFVIELSASKISPEGGAL